MDRNEFNFYNSENDGYRGGFGDYTDPTPNYNGVTPPQPQKPRRSISKRAIALVLTCALVGGGAGIGGAALYNASTQPETVIYQGERPQVETVANNNNNQPMTPEQLYAANLASCVGITVSTTTQIRNRNSQDRT